MWRALISSCFGVCAACSVPVVAPLPPTGEEIAFGGGRGGAGDACFACHGLKGEGDGDAPRLAGQSAGYLIKQMEDYARRWRDHPDMSAIASRLEAGDRTASSLYYSSLRQIGEKSMPTVGPSLFFTGDATRGISPCAGCHGDQGEGKGLAIPMLAGQPAAYVAAQLRAWKTSKRRNDPEDVMGSVARKLSDAEIEVLAVYVESLP